MIALRSLIAPGIVVAVSAGLVYGGWYVGVASTERTQLERDKAVADAAQVMRNAVAEEVGKIKVESKTYVRNFKEIERVNPVFVDCKLPDDAKRLLDTALSGAGQQPVPDKLPE
jgi:hypothetical protein